MGVDILLYDLRPPPHTHTYMAGCHINYNIKNFNFGMSLDAPKFLCVMNFPYLTITYFSFSIRDLVATECISPTRSTTIVESVTGQGEPVVGFTRADSGRSGSIEVIISSLLTMISLYSDKSTSST